MCIYLPVSVRLEGRKRTGHTTHTHTQTGCPTTTVPCVGFAFTYVHMCIGSLCGAVEKVKWPESIDVRRVHTLVVYVYVELEPLHGKRLRVLGETRPPPERLRASVCTSPLDTSPHIFTRSHPKHKVIAQQVCKCVVAFAGGVLFRAIHTQSCPI